MSIIHGDFIPDEEKVGRLLKNALGVEETVLLSTKHWKHFDWLVEQGYDMVEWVKQSDLSRHSYDGYYFDFSGHVEVQLVLDESDRQARGEEVPLFINPNRPEL